MNYRPVIIAIIQTLGLFVAGFIIPVLGQAVALFAPVPLILLSVREGRVPELYALAASSVLLAFLLGWQVAAVFFLSFGLMAIGTAEGMRRQWKPESVAFLGGLLPVAALTIATGCYFAATGKNPAVVIEEYLRESLAEAAGFYTQIGLTETAAAVNSASAALIHHLVRLIPGITVATSVFQAACCFGLSRLVLLKKPEKAPVLSSPSLADWYAPDSWVWGLIAALVLILVPVQAAKIAGWNLSILYAVVYLTQGVSVIEHYLRKARIRPFIRGLMHSLILALPSVVFVIALGVVDIWADLRKVRVSVQTS